MIVTFECADCAVAVEFECEGECADSAAERANYWDAARHLRERGWSISRSHPTRCDECYRKRNEGLLDKPLRGWR